MTDYLENNKLISYNQGGFRGGYRTTDHIFILKTLLNKYLHKLKNKLFVCFVDFKKAFDSVDRKALFQKLEKKGIGGNFLKIIKDMYSNTLYSCKFGDSYTDPFLATLGVKQGDSLSPTLFNLFVDDIDSAFTENINTKPVNLGKHIFNHLLYADDLVILSESPTGLQNCLNSLGNYCKRWRLNINVKKTKVMIFSKTVKKANTDHNSLNFKLNDKELEIVDEYKYLGITVTSNGQLKYAADILSQKARKAFFGLKANIPSSDNLSVQKWLKLYEAMIVPILTYGSEIWIADHNINLENLHNFTFEKTQSMIMKNILGVHNKTANLAIYTELGITPLCFKTFKLMFKYYNRLKKIESSTEYVYDLLRSAFQEDKKLTLEKFPSWGKSVEYLKTLFKLETLDLSHVQFDKEIKALYINKLMNQLNHMKNSESGKLRFYSKIISNFELQKYLTFNINKYLRLNLTKLRLSAHNLAIETGRYCKPIIPANERYCKSCKDKVEDEHHFLIDCPIYNQVREKFFTLFNKQMYPNETSMESINRLLNPSSIQELKNICSYLKESYPLRDTVFKDN